MNIEQFVQFRNELPEGLMFTQYIEIMNAVKQLFIDEYAWEEEVFFEFYPKDVFNEEIDLITTTIPDKESLELNATLDIQNKRVIQTLTGNHIQPVTTYKTFEDYNSFTDYVKKADSTDYVTLPYSLHDKIKEKEGKL